MTTSVAEVGKEAITVTDIQKVIQDAIRRKDIPAEMAQIYAPQVIDQYISERALAYEANRIGLSVSDEELANTIRGLLTRFTGGAAGQSSLRAHRQRPGVHDPPVRSEHAQTDPDDANPEHRAPGES